MAGSSLREPRLDVLVIRHVIDEFPTPVLSPLRSQGHEGQQFDHCDDPVLLSAGVAQYVLKLAQQGCGIHRHVVRLLGLVSRDSSAPVDAADVLHRRVSSCPPRPGGSARQGKALTRPEARDEAGLERGCPCFGGVEQHSEQLQRLVPLVPGQGDLLRRPLRLGPSCSEASAQESIDDRQLGLDGGLGRYPELGGAAQLLDGPYRDSAASEAQFGHCQEMGCFHALGFGQPRQLPAHVDEESPHQLLGLEGAFLRHLLYVDGLAAPHAPHACIAVGRAEPGSKAHEWFHQHAIVHEPFG